MRHNTHNHIELPTWNDRMPDLTQGRVIRKQHTRETIAMIPARESIAQQIHF
ncbi:hypothetical protein SXCC_02040 [Gluconacetobacter sp. SXCC-1]|nr:hypothetical protein SXCC_02040 [Gluconacetobacter sp. SXCC-1]